MSDKLLESEVHYSKTKLSPFALFYYLDGVVILIFTLVYPLRQNWTRPQHNKRINIDGHGLAPTYVQMLNV